MKMDRCVDPAVAPQVFGSVLPEPWRQAFPRWPARLAASSMYRGRAAAVVSIAEAGDRDWFPAADFRRQSTTPSSAVQLAARGEERVKSFAIQRSVAPNRGALRDLLCAPDRRPVAQCRSPPNDQYRHPPDRIAITLRRLVADLGRNRCPTNGPTKPSSRGEACPAAPGSSPTRALFPRFELSLGGADRRPARSEGGATVLSRHLRACASGADLLTARKQASINRFSAWRCETMPEAGSLPGVRLAAVRSQLRLAQS